MAVSGEKSPRPRRPVQSVQPVKKPVKQKKAAEMLVQPAETGESETKEITSFDDILGLVSVSVCQLCVSERQRGVKAMCITEAWSWGVFKCTNICMCHQKLEEIL